MSDEDLAKNSSEQKDEAGNENSAESSAVALAADDNVEVAANNEQMSGVELGGAVRFQYSYEAYDSDNKDRGGDFDFDTFRLDLNGNVGDVILSAQYRWFDYMDVIHHAWVGYNFYEEQQARIGITKVPFGILPYASHNFFFSANYYVGLEDDYDMGVNYSYVTASDQLDLAFYKNDEQGGIDGYVSDRSERYSYDVVGVRLEGEGIFDVPTLQAAETNTLNGRYAHIFNFDQMAVEVGVSGQVGQLELDQGKDGDHFAAALHSVIDVGQWNIQLQASTYEYDVDGMNVDQMVVGAYAFFDTIAAEADLYLANIAYSQPVQWGPVSNLTFYNDYTLVSGKSGNLEDTFMNVTGVAVTAGGLYTYFDYVMAENQPFIGGSMAGDGDTEHRFNANFGYYF
ncbi:OprO/OprP family phosphate-selective porin [Neiella marina]|uniref:OprO/OprP family phosphate-selective porin n=1 Tax=Neiella holothuriorum TaxID=2870530 RepID=A0ABS7EE35_9GAMM|nr:OprO/OprP family phosphate-selective porin [Neiella holothuriorum]